MQIKATAQVMTISPKVAAEWLNNRWGEQRKVRKSTVNRFAIAIKAFRAYVNGIKPTVLRWNRDEGFPEMP